MESKIEKLDMPEDAIYLRGLEYVNILQIAEKVNQIIDHLNSQDQAEEKPVYVMCMGEEIVAGTDKSIKKHKKDTEDFLKTQSTPEVYRSKEDMERTDYTDYPDYPQETTTESTPEQKEEGGCKGFWSYYRHKGDDRELAYLIVDGEKFLSEESVKNLLSERERKVLEHVLIEVKEEDLVDKAVEDYIEGWLSKLNKKK